MVLNCKDNLTHQV